MSTKIGICFIQDFPSVMEGISILTGVSKNQLKKELSKKELNRSIKKQDELQLPINLFNYGKINPIYLGPVIKSLFEDDQFLVLSKPHKVHCHPLGYDENDNVLSYLSTIAPELLEVDKQSYDRGLFYRLDFETSGLLYLAKSDSIQSQMRQQFSTAMKAKKYLAVVDGKADQEKVLKHHLSSYGEKKSLVKVDEQGELCECHYHLLEYNETEDLSLIEVNLKQGFRHQIRVQLQADGHAIVGDPLYGNREYSRLMLHCYQYVFDCNGIHYEIKDDSFATNKLLGSLFTYFNS